ncbi:DUF4304 domain-containing protein [Desertivirga xinjiangensis]|uniref:DUF4304 domain-containing protein n=1 Tax=Desertivirga xinjiangensis TaxID=539206 RepID=UPI00210E53BE|nr:DUF4304 domain-containing protein [Pedobacter xinjiangensis]
MQKTDVETGFDFLVSQVIWPHFKQKGYKKSGNNLRFYDTSSCWGKIVNFQKSCFYGKNHISFTVNIGLYLPEAEKFHCNQQANEKFQEVSCIVRKRIGRLTKENKDLWFDLTVQTDKNMLYTTVEKHSIDLVIPYLNKVNSKDDILKILSCGYRSEYKASQIQTLYSNGYKKEAKQQLEEAKNSTRNVSFLETLNEIEQSFRE